MNRWYVWVSRDGVHWKQSMFDHEQDALDYYYGVCIQYAFVDIRQGSDD